jgi:hypothetical protein
LLVIVNGYQRDTLAVTSDIVADKKSIGQKIRKMDPHQIVTIFSQRK